MGPTTALLLPEIQELIAERHFAELRGALASFPPADVAEIVSELAPEQSAVAFRFLPRDEAADVFAYLDVEHQEGLIANLGAEGLVGLFDELSTDDLATLVDELPADVAQRVVNSISPENRKLVQAILGYPAESVGRLMTPDYVRLRKGWTVSQALDHLRKHGRDAETINVVYVVDEGDRLISDLRLRKLLLAPLEMLVEAVEDDIPTSLRADQDREEAVRMMARYDRVALPVVDRDGKLLGIVTSDDVADVAEQEATEDIQKLAGVEALDEPYADTPVREMLKKRGSVLGLLLVWQSLTIVVLGVFESVLSQAAALVLFIPMIIASGGNSGTQAASLIVRSLALHELAPRDYAWVLRRELVTGLFLGLGMGALASISVVLWDLTPFVSMQGTNPLKAGLAVGAAVQAIVVYAVAVGSMLPLMLQRMKLDPAVISSPLVATIMDVSGLLIYLGVAMAFIRWMGL